VIDALWLRTTGNLGYKAVICMEEITWMEEEAAEEDEEGEEGADETTFFDQETATGIELLAPASEILPEVTSTILPPQELQSLVAPPPPFTNSAEVSLLGLHHVAGSLVVWPEGAQLMQHVDTIDSGKAGSLASWLKFYGKHNSSAQSQEFRVDSDGTAYSLQDFCTFYGTDQGLSLFALVFFFSHSTPK